MAESPGAAVDADALIAVRQPWRVRLRGHLFTTRYPVSAEAMLRHQAAMAAAGSDPVAQRRAHERLLRQAFGYSIAYWWLGDPVHLLLDHPYAEALLADFFAIPTWRRSAPRRRPEELDDWDRLEAANRDPLSEAHARAREAATPEPSLALMCAQLEAVMPTWYYNPGRWETFDGFVPYRLAVLQYRVSQSVKALDRLHLLATLIDFERVKRGADPAPIVDALLREAAGG